jgi:hypothetical protein
MAASADGLGYWLVGADGGVFAFGDAQFYGSLGGIALDAPIVAIVAAAGGHGYWLVGADGGVFTFGDAQFRGSLGGQHLESPIVGMSVLFTPYKGTSFGYWLVAADGTIHDIGSIYAVGTLANAHLASTVVGVTQGFLENVIGRIYLGFFIALADGEVYGVGYTDDPIPVEPGQVTGPIPKLAAPIVGITVTGHSGLSSLDLAGADGGVFTSGGAEFFGSRHGETLNAPIVGIADAIGSGGYWLVGADGGVFTFGDAGYYGSIPSL